MVLDDYSKLDRVLTNGSFITVQLIKSKKNSEISAMHTFKLDKMPDRGALHIAMTEPDLLKGLVHAFMIRIYECSPDERNANLFHIVCEYYDRGTVADRISANKTRGGTPFEPGTILKWSAQLVAAVDYLHKAGLVHGAICPDHLCLRENDDIKLGDLFTLCKGTSTLTFVLNNPPTAQTLPFSAPERFEGQLCFLSDEWSMGATIFNFATLEVPFGAENEQSIFRNISANRLSKPMTAIEPSDVRNVVSKLLVTDVKKRSSSADILRTLPSWKKFSNTKYARGDKLGRGSYGTVYYVTCQVTKQTFVMKRVDNSQVDPDEFRKAKQEIIALCQLNHPNIVAYHDSYEDAEGYSIIMELCAGGNLSIEIEKRKLGDKTPFGDSQILKWAGQLLSAIDYIHDRGIMHRDIKPGNIFLNDSMDVKLGDFGGVKITSSSGRAETVIGSPNYIAPDVIKACFEENGSYTSIVDEWSAGVVMFELATLKVPISARNVASMFSKLQSRKFDVPMTEIKSATIRAIVEKLLTYEPALRCTAKEIIPVIEGAMKSLTGPRPVPEVVTVKDYKDEYEVLADLVPKPGTFGFSYSAREKFSSQPVLVVLKVRKTGNDDASILNELQVLMSLKHRNLLQYSRLFKTQNNEIAFTLEFAQQGNLAKFLARRRGVCCEEQEMIQILKHIVSGLDFLHQKGIVHGDISSTNIFFKRVWKLGDVGVALKRRTLDEIINNFSGKVAYLAPELVIEKHGGHTPASDMWAFGCVVHEIATLKRTFQESEPSLTIKSIKTGSVKTVTGYSQNVLNWISGCLEKDPRSRLTAVDANRQISATSTQ